MTLSKKLKFLICGIAICSLTGSANCASASVLGILAGDKVEDIISKFEGSMRGIVAAAGSEARVTMMATFQQYDASIQSMKLAYADSMGKTMKELGKQDQIFFENFDNAMSNIEQKVKGPVSEMTSAINNATTLVAQVTVKKPLVLSYSPSNIAPANNGSDVTFQVNG